jgi:TRAP-type uncharacterized transport system substrate-binding protein
MEPLPGGANFMRAKTLWEIGLHIAGNPETKYGGNRDMCVVVGSGSGESFKPWLRLATGAAVLAEAVAAGEVELAFVNPSAMLTQAYRGVGIFEKPLPVRVVAQYPSWDRFVCVVHPRTGINSIADIKARKIPLKLSLREERDHSTRALTDQLFGLYGFTLHDLESWGATFQYVGPPGDPRRINAMKAGEIEAILDEGISHNEWFEQALANGWKAIEFEPEITTELEKLGWRRVMIPKGRYPHLTHDYACLDFGGWPLYTRADLPDEAAYAMVAGIAARAEQIPWEEGAYTGVGQLGQDTEATPLDVPLHPGAERWYREHGFIK